jgi:hypothetical protein
MPKGIGITLTGIKFSQSQKSDLADLTGHAWNSQEIQRIVRILWRLVRKQPRLFCIRLRLIEDRERTY